MLPSKLEVNNSAIIVHNEAGRKEGRKEGRRERKDVHFPFDLNNASKVASFAAERGLGICFRFPGGRGRERPRSRAAIHCSYFAYEFLIERGGPALRVIAPCREAT